MSNNLNEYNDDFKQGLVLPIVEHFYSLQGEGYHTGKAAWFIRIGGCDIGCNWCDAKFTWDNNPAWLINVDELLSKIENNYSNSIVITGGEPLMYNLNYLCNELKKRKYTTFLETSGSLALSGKWDWICLSPKKKYPPLNEMYIKANELKVIIHDISDLDWAEQCSKRVLDSCILLLQPEWSRYNELIHEITNYIKRYPKWRISLQAHKFMNIP